MMQDLQKACWFEQGIATVSVMVLWQRGHEPVEWVSGIRVRPVARKSRLLGRVVDIVDEYLVMGCACCRLKVES